MISMNSSWHVFFAAALLVFCGGNLVWLQMYGTSGNVIQQSCVTGYFWMMFATACSLGVVPAVALGVDYVKTLGTAKTSA